LTVSMHVVKMVSASSRDVSGSVWRPCMLAVLSQTDSTVWSLAICHLRVHLW